MSDRKQHAWLVFYGTTTTIVMATTKSTAYTAFITSRFPPHGKQGRIVPPTRHEVTIRRPNEGDRAWIEDSGSPAFLALLPKLAKRSA